MILLVKQMKGLIRYWQAQLETEESGTKCAVLQGKIAGSNKFLSIISEYYSSADLIDGEIDLEFPVEYSPDSEKWYCKETNYEKLVQWKKQADDASFILNNKESELNEAVGTKKDWLFYEAKKSRDLHYIKGWYFGMSMIEDWTVAIKDGYEIALKKKNQELDLYDDEEEEN